MDPANPILLLFIPLLPLFGAMINGLAGHRLPRGVVGTIASALPIGSFLLAVLAYRQLVGMDPDARALQLTVYTWIESGVFSVPFALRLDQLSCVMVLVVTGVGSLIHVYSNGYMHEDRSPARYFAYLNLFTFAMLTLVMADNLILMFVGWEGVGVCSYLLIGFWYEDMEKAIAGKKAFVVNRIGDFGFLLGFFLLFWTLAELGTATSTFRGIEEQVHLLQNATIFTGTSWEVSTVTVVCILFFVGACGKSAQIPLYVWLPDAMAGPTPVSALIHAATMVTAGVYMVARLNFLYTMAPEAQALVAGVGALTAVFAATIGLFQHDIKKVLAYSTVSQLGYMFIGVGVGAYSAGVFHLVTHAFFKGLMFLGAGSVILGMHHQQDIRKMGGLLKLMPWTGWTFLAGWLAIIGFPGTSGFFSKDEVLWMALSKGHTNIWLLGVIGAALTSFYMTRLVVVTFFGKLRLSEEELHHLPGHRVHESPQVMTIPLFILAVLSLVAGVIGVPHLLGEPLHLHNYFHEWLAPLLNEGHGGHGASHAILSEPAAMGIAILTMIVSSGLAVYLYSGDRLARQSEKSDLYLSGPEAGGFMGSLYRMINAKYYIDEIYDATVVRLVRYGSRDYLWPFDKWAVDRAVNIAGDVVKAIGGVLGFLQNGNVKRYLLGMAVGVALIIIFVVFAAPALASVLGG
jgi:NADH-quinone oxidoreductase subunit L